MHIKQIEKSDIENTIALLESIQLFEDQEIDYMKTIIENLSAQSSDTEGFLICSVDGSIIGAAYYKAETLTEDVYNILFIGVHPDHQNSGVGAKMLSYTEQLLKNQNARVLLVETSSDEAFVTAWNFYKKHGYTIAGKIAQFYGKNEDKVIYSKIIG